MKPQLDIRDEVGQVVSRMGLKKKCSFVETLLQMKDEEILKYDCVVVDEAQFCTKEQVEFFIHIVDDLKISVICYGLRTDFRRELFSGSMWLLAWADVIEEIKTVCWCGEGANSNLRFTEEGKVIKQGAQVCLGGNDQYIALCRKHYKEGNLGPGSEQVEEERYV